MSWLSGYAYRKKVTISGSSGAGENYQVKLSIGSSSGGDFHLEGHCVDFPNDIRFTDDDGTTLLDYWIEDASEDPITVWVEVRDNLDNNVDIHVYYGKSGDSSASDGDATFLFFDDFSNAGEWEVSDGISIDTANKKLVATNVDRSGDDRGSYKNDIGIDGGSSFKIHGSFKWTGSGGNCAFFCGIASAKENARTVDNLIGFYFHDEAGGSDMSLRVVVNDVGASSPFWDNEDHFNVLYNYVIIKNGNNLEAKLWDSSHSEENPSFTASLTDKDFSGINFVTWQASNHDTGHSGSGFYFSGDFYNPIFIRKYTDPEPSFSSAQAEEELVFTCGDILGNLSRNYWAIHGASSDVFFTASSSLSIRELLSLCSETLKFSDTSQSILSLFVQSQDNLELSDSSLLGSLLLASAIDTLNIDDGCHLILSFTHNCLDTLHSLDSTSFPLPSVLNCLDSLGAEDTLSSLLTVLCQSKDSIGGADGESSQLSSLSVLFDKLSSIDSTLSNVTFKQTLLDSLFLHDNSTLLLTILVFASDILASHDFNAVRLEFSSSSLDILKSQDNTSTNVVIHLDSADILKGADFISANLQALLSALSTFQQSDLTSSYKTLTGIPIKIFKAQHKILVFRAE